MVDQKASRISRRPRREWVDRYYKQMFSHPEMVIDLLSGFVEPSRSDELDFSTLERLSSDWVSSDLRRYQGDLVWRVKFRDRDEYLVVVLECQSTVDPSMMARMLNYAGLLCLDIFRSAPKEKLPGIVLIVLYSGERLWNAACFLETMWSLWGLCARYFLLDQRRHPLAQLVPNNLVSCLIALIQERRSFEALQPWLRGLRMRLQEIGKEDLTKTFNGWFMEVSTMREDIQKHIDPDLPPLEQMKQMEELVMDWPDPDWAKGWLETGRMEGLTEGREKGLTEGREEGREEGLTEGREKGLTEGREEGLTAGCEKTLGAFRKELCRQAASKFDPETVERLTEHLDQISDPKLLVKISSRLTESKSGAALLKCLDGRA